MGFEAMDMILRVLLFFWNGMTKSSWSIKLYQNVKWCENRAAKITSFAVFLKSGCIDQTKKLPRSNHQLSASLQTCATVAQRMR